MINNEVPQYRQPELPGIDEVLPVPPQAMSPEDVTGLSSQVAANSAHNAQEGQNDVYDRRDEVAMDQGVRTPYMIERRDGAAPRQSRRQQGPVRPRQEGRSLSHRGGRSFPEGTESELDPYWNVPQTPISPEQSAKNTEWIAKIRANLANGGEAQDHPVER